MNEQLIALLREIRPNFGDVGTRDVDVRRKQNQIDEAIAILAAESDKQEAVYAEPVEKRTCPICNGAGSHGGRFHIDDKGSSEYEPYKCDMCDGFGTVHIETREPVAWRIFDGEGNYDYTDTPPSDSSVHHASMYGRKFEPLYAHPIASADDDVRDAERYRWLREEGEAQWAVVKCNAGEYLDAAIDAAIAANRASADTKEK